MKTLSQIPWNKGKTKEDYPQMSNSGVKKGNPSPNRGVKMSEEQRLKLSKAHKGQVSWNKGNIGYRAGIRRVPEGFHHTDITRRKMSQAHLAIREKHWAWKGGITPINHALRTSFGYEEWRKKVFERDLYTCKRCDEVGGRLEADHIKPWSLYPELRFDLSNGRTLCKDCHKLIGWSLFRENNPKTIQI